MKRPKKSPMTVHLKEYQTLIERDENGDITAKGIAAAQDMLATAMLALLDVSIKDSPDCALMGIPATGVTPLMVGVVARGDLAETLTAWLLNTHDDCEEAAKSATRH